MGIFSTALRMKHLTNPVTPSAGSSSIYFKDDGGLYVKNATGAERPVMSAVSALHSNPNFESNQGDGTPTDWSTFWSSGATYAADTAAYVEGTRSLKTTVPSGANGVIQSGIFAAPSDSIVTASVWAKCSEVGSLELHLLTRNGGSPDFFDANSTRLGQSYTVGTAWQQITATFAVPNGHNVARLVLAPAGGAVTRTYWYDSSSSSVAAPTTNYASPIGSIDAFAGITAPQGWLMCDGSAKSRTTYAALFGVCGTRFGAGDGSTTFNVPDLRGRSPMGVGQAVGGGSIGNNYALGQKFGHEAMQAHNHAVSDSGHGHATPGHGFNWGPGGNVHAQINAVGGAASNNWLHTIQTSWATTYAAFTGIGIQNSGAGDSQNVHPVLGLNHIIRAL